MSELYCQLRQDEKLYETMIGKEQIKIISMSLKLEKKTKKNVEKNLNQLKGQSKLEKIQWLVNLLSRLVKSLRCRKIFILRQKRIANYNLNIINLTVNKRNLKIDIDSSKSLLTQSKNKLKTNANNTKIIRNN